MLQQKSRKVLIYIFLFLVVGTLNNKNFHNLSYTGTSKFIVTGLDEKNNLELLNNLNLLKISNLFFLNELKIAKVIDSNNLVEKYSVFKNYPSTINITIDKAIFLAQIKKNGDDFFLGSNGKLIKKKQIKQDIPYIFGDFKNKNFFELKRVIDESRFNYKEIKNLYFFQSGRWDIETNSGLLIKLPKKNLDKSFKLLTDILNKDQQKIIDRVDLRQYNQIVINER